MAIEIVSFPIENGDFFHSYVSHYQRVPVFSYNGLSPTSHGQSPEQNAVELQRGTAQWFRRAQFQGENHQASLPGDCCICRELYVCNVSMYMYVYLYMYVLCVYLYIYIWIVIHLHICFKYG